MATVAVTGASSPLGKALLERLDADPRVARIVGIDLDEPEMPVAKLEFRTADVRDPLLHLVIDGADALVHIPTGDPLELSEDALFALHVHGTRNVLAAAARSAVRAVVIRSSGAVYGAHPDNAFPLTEDAPLRANEDFPLAQQFLRVERLVDEWSQSNPDTRVVLLRPAVVLGAEVDGWIARYLESPRVPLVRGHQPPLQFAHVDDVAAALHLAVTRPLEGAYNVACEGWLSVDEVQTLLGRRTLELPHMPAFAAAEWLWRRRLVAGPPGMLHFVMHPWVLSSARLRGEGWAPLHGNREVLREFGAAHHGWLSLGRVRVSRRELYVGAFAGLGLMLGVLVGARRAHTRNGRPPAH